MVTLGLGWLASSEEEPTCSPSPCYSVIPHSQQLYIWISSCCAIKVIMHFPSFIREADQIAPSPLINLLRALPRAATAAGSCLSTAPWLKGSAETAGILQAGGQKETAGTRHGSAFRLLL